MNPFGLLPAVLPVGTFALTAYACRPRGAVTGPVRLTLVRAAVLVGGYAVATVELLSLRDWLTYPGVLVTWLVGLAAATAAAGWRRRVDGAWPKPGLVARWRDLGPVERVLVGAIAGLALAELVLGLASAPNTYDSQTYHLPKIEHWVAQHHVGVYATIIQRQNTYPPGAEYLLTHLRLLTGGDVLYALVQWGAGLLCVLAVSRLVGQLGGGRRAQLLAAFVLASTPLVVLESSSTQTDLVVAAWAAGLATLALDGVGRRAGPAGAGTVVLLGVATGLVAVTKQTGLLAAAPLLLWWGLARARRLPFGPLVAAGAGLVVVGLAAALAGPFLWRNDAEYGNPLGPDYARRSVTMQRHDPAAVLVNAARQAHTALDPPIPALGRWGAHAVDALARAVHVDPQDPRITFDGTTFPTVAWYPSEDKASFPIPALLAVAGLVVAFGRPGRRLYALALIAGGITHAALLKWQPWGNRLMLYELVLATPLAGLVLDEVFSWAAARVAGVRRAVAWAMAVVLAVGGAAGALSAAYGWPRRLVGGTSVFALDRYHTRFVERPTWAADFAAVAGAVRASGARRVGIAQGYDTWEYPWWVFLPGRQLVALQSNAPHHPQALPDTVDAVICLLPDAAQCQRFAPAGWPVTMHGAAGYALPPGRAGSPG